MLVDSRYATAAELRAIATRLAVTAVGPYWKVDRSRSAPLTALRYEERQPRLWERLLITGTDQIRTISNDEDRWQTWQWNDLFGTLADPPSTRPLSADDAVIAYNIARSNHDDAAAEAARTMAMTLVQGQGSASTSERFPIRYDNDLTLVGVNVTQGAATVVTLLWETGPGFVPFDGEYLIRSKVIEAPMLWTSTIDYFEKETAPPMWPKVSAWKPDRLYVQRYVDMRRVGTERFDGLWSTRGGQAPKTAGRDRFTLFTLR
ncbi:MAG: hypothetical protein U0165_07245 [Polyangiaceae bacterium]